jgi:hypothetical protein
LFNSNASLRWYRAIVPANGGPVTTIEEVHAQTISGSSRLSHFFMRKQKRMAIIIANLTARFLNIYDVITDPGIGEESIVVKPTVIKVTGALPERR